MNDWRSEIKRRADAHPRGLAGIGAEIGIKRNILSALVHGKYRVSAKTLRRLESQVCAWLGQEHLVCPHLGRRITEADCIGYRDRPRPKADPAGLRHWAQCAECSLGAAIAAKQQRGVAQAAPENATTKNDGAQHA